MAMPGDEGRLGPALESLLRNGAPELVRVQLSVPVEVHEAEDALAHHLLFADGAQQLPVSAPVQVEPAYHVIDSKVKLMV